MLAGNEVCDGGRLSGGDDSVLVEERSTSVRCWLRVFFFRGCFVLRCCIEAFVRTLKHSMNLYKVYYTFMIHSTFSEATNRHA